MVWNFSGVDVVWDDLYFFFAGGVGRSPASRQTDKMVGVSTTSSTVVLQTSICCGQFQVRGVPQSQMWS